MHVDISVTKLYVEGAMQYGYEAKIILLRSQLRGLAQEYSAKVGLLKQAKKILSDIVVAGHVQMGFDATQHYVEIRKAQIRKAARLLKKLKL